MDLIKLTLVSLAVWMNRQQQDVIDYLQEEVRVLEGSMGCDGSNGLFHGGSVDVGRIGSLPCALRDPPLNSGGEDCRDHS